MSLPVKTVPCVPEISENGGTILDRYIRQDQDPMVIAGTTSLPEIPVIDFGNLRSDGDWAKTELEKYHSACKDRGFFHVTNHGMSQSLMEAVKIGAVELFYLPKEEKTRYAQIAGEMEEFGQAFIVSDNQKLDWAEVFYMLTLPRNLRKPHLFPELPLPYRDDLDVYTEETKKLAIELLHLLGKALGMEAKEVVELFDYGAQGLRMNRYPPCPQPELAIGRLNSHSNADAITILLQVNETEGLQIRKNGKWIPVRPFLGALIINIGDIIEIVTNGIYQGINHRVTVNAVKERVSIASFYSPKTVNPAPGIVTPETPALFLRITVAEHLNGYLTSKLKGKAYLYSMRI